MTNQKSAREYKCTGLEIYYWNYTTTSYQGNKGSFAVVATGEDVGRDIGPAPIVLAKGDSFRGSSMGGEVLVADEGREKDLEENYDTAYDNCEEKALLAGTYPAISCWAD